MRTGCGVRVQKRKAFNRKDRKGGAKIAKENRRGDRKERCTIGASPSEVFGRRDRLGQALGGERGVLLGGVDVGCYQAIVDFNIFDVLGILMFDIALDGGGRRLQRSEAKAIVPCRCPYAGNRLPPESRRTDSRPGSCREDIRKRKGSQ